MISAQELRVGNKILSPFGKIETVLDISDNTNRGTIEYVDVHHKAMYSHCITVMENRNQYKPCELNGVPLSPGILEKAGFEYTWERYYRKENMGEVYLNRSRQGWLVKVSISTPLTSVKYLHHLMNLYFAITGEELTLNP